MSKKKVKLREINGVLYYVNDQGIHIEVVIAKKLEIGSGIIQVTIRERYTKRIVRTIEFSPDRGVDRIPGIEWEDNRTSSIEKFQDHAQYIAGRPSHDHKPGGSSRWQSVQDSAKRTSKKELSGTEAGIMYACANLGPTQVVKAVRLYFLQWPMAKRHLDHYLYGNGRVFNESENIKVVIGNDLLVRQRIGQKIKKQSRGNFFLRQADYIKEDYQYSWGGIDRFEWKITDNKKFVDLWFADRYDYHPLGHGYKRFSGPGDKDIRRTNCVHAAMVEMKKQGAKDYWMKGKARLPISTFIEEHQRSATPRTWTPQWSPPYKP